MARGAFKVTRDLVPGIDAVEADSAHQFAKHTHDRFGIGVIQRGAQRSLSGRGQVEAAAGDLITVNPGEVHDGVSVGSDGRRWSMLYFAPDLIARIVTDVEEGRRGSAEFVHPVVREGRLRAVFQALCRVYADPLLPARCTAREELELQVVDALICDRHTASRPSTRSSPALESISRVRSMIDEDPAAPWTLDDFAREAGLSRFKVVRSFAKAAGLTPHAYIVQRRVELVRHLIAGGAALADAAAAAGFADQSHMTRTFVKRYGYSPGAFAAGQN